MVSGAAGHRDAIRFSAQEFQSGQSLLLVLLSPLAQLELSSSVFSVLPLVSDL